MIKGTKYFNEFACLWVRQGLFRFRLKYREESASHEKYYMNQILNFQKKHDNIAGPCLDKPAEIRCASCVMDTSYFFSDLSLEAKVDLQSTHQYHIW